MSHVDLRERQAAIDQFLVITNSQDTDLASDILQNSDWDIQRAVNLVLSEPSNMQIDDSAQNRPSPSSLSPPRPLLAILSFPLHILSNVFRFIFSILRIPIPRISFSTLSFYSPRATTTRSRTRATNASAPARWLRQLEEDTGAVSIGKTAVTASTTATPGPSSLTSRSNLYDDHQSLLSAGVKLLPDFTLSTYDEALKTCQREARIGCIILVSEEHDDVAEFKHSTLTDSDFVKLLYDNNILVWGGDVREHDAWSAAEKLQATTYPFVAFIALQPRRTPFSRPQPTSSSDTSSPTPNQPTPTLTVLSRHQGPPGTSSTPGPTHASTLTSHITSHILPRVTPFLDRLHAAQRERERDRQIREEQDAAFREAAERDRQRIEGKMEQERMEREREQRQKDEEERRKEQVKHDEREKEKRMVWRRWIRRRLSSLPSTTSGLKIAVRLPTGGRVIQTFGPTKTLTSLYAFVDAQLVPSHLDPREDPLAPPTTNDENSDIDTRIERHITGSEWWGFQLALAYPRKEIPWSPNVKLTDVDVLSGGGAQVVVEMMQREKNGNNAEGGDDDDGYDTEEDE